jgi:hypothetical protein
MDGWMDGWVNGWFEGWMGKETDRHICRYIDKLDQERTKEEGLK